jgi:Ca2+-transporting ATPase
VAKQAVAQLAEETPLAERTNMVFRSTAVASGAGRAVVVATGSRTEVGRIGRLTSGLHAERTPLERRLDSLGRRLVWLALAIAGVVAVMGLVRGQPLSFVVGTALALAIAAVPEGLPAVATIALAVGVRRMARRHVLIRRLPQVETLGSTTVVCTDKTGTLTAGVMTVTALWLHDREVSVSGTGYLPEGAFSRDGREVGAAGDPVLMEALRIGLLCNRAQVRQREDGRWEGVGDPTEAALLVAARKAGLDRAAVLEESPEVGEVPFSSERAWMATVHRGTRGVTAMVKGAPGRIVDGSVRISTAEGEIALDDAGRERVREKNRELAARGLRVLALARGTIAEGAAAEARDLTLVGLAAIEDPVAEGVRDTIRSFAGGGVRTVMITGDQRLTAEAVARRLGLLDDGREVMEGRELARLEDADLAGRLARVAALSRVSPEDKLRIVSGLQAAGEIVAMLGDGVNDAPALKKADVGVAMGRRGTDVAREAAAVVLEDDRFPTLAAAAEEGRVIFDNIRKFVFYLFSCNLAEILVLLAAGLLGLPQPLLPLQILWLNLVTDTLPALSLAVEPGAADVMRRPPRNPQRGLLSRRFLAGIGLYASLIAVPTLAGYLLALRQGPPARAVTIAFLVLGLAQGFHLGNARNTASVLRPAQLLGNRWALAALVSVVALQVAAVEMPPLAAVLGLVPLSGHDWLLALGLSLVPGVIGQAVRRLREEAAAGGLSPDARR